MRTHICTLSHVLHAHHAAAVQHKVMLHDADTLSAAEHVSTPSTATRKILLPVAGAEVVSGLGVVQLAQDIAAQSSAVSKNGMGAAGRHWYTLLYQQESLRLSRFSHLQNGLL